MTSKKVNSQSTASKATSLRFSTEVEEILGVTFGYFGAVTRSKVATLGQQTLQVSSASTPVFGSSTPKRECTSTNALEGGSSISEKIKKTVALLSNLALRTLPPGRTMIQSTNRLCMHRVT
uniref:Uncharacterized protein n=1 Tax=Solanum tuberosum TaxID=4113 RepID=M1DS75_SOLTU